MGEHNGVRFRIETGKRPSGWCFGIGLSHFYEEIYLYINFYKLFVIIGFLNEDCV